MDNPIDTSEQPAGFFIHPDTSIGHVQLRVSDVQRALHFYQTLLGFKVIGKPSSENVFLSAGGEAPHLIALTKSKTVSEGLQRRAGLYHFAILLPDRKHLASVFQHLLEHRGQVHFEGAADHAVSEALYLRDPDLNGIEIYRDRSEWKRIGQQIQMTTQALDFKDLLREADDAEWRGVPLQTVIGHIHLHVSNLEKAKRFYKEALGLNHTCTYPGAYFFAADEYHHHIATNIWMGEDIPPTPEDYPGLDHFSIRLPNKQELSKLIRHLTEQNVSIEESDKHGLSQSVFVRDPDRIKIELYTE